MNHISKIFLILVTSFTVRAEAQSFNFTGGTYTQTFDTLADAGSGLTWSPGVTLPGWYISQSTYSADDGSSTAPGIYSFGSSSERALGSLADASTGKLMFVLRLHNSTGITIDQFSVAWYLEQWRNGGDINHESIGLSLSFNPSGLFTSGAGSNWIISSYQQDQHQTTGGTPGPVDGSVNRGLASVSISGFTWQDGSDLYLRWEDYSAPQPKSSLAIDDVSFGAVPEPTSTVLLAIGLFSCLVSRRHR
jgi:hypothetical protein